MKSAIRILLCLLLVVAPLLSTQANAHTISIGYENAGTGALNFWYGSYHSPTENPANSTEGSFNLVGINGNPYPLNNVPFTLHVSSKPAGLIDGSTNFFASGTFGSGDPLTPTNTLTGSFNPVKRWQGATFTGLLAGDYQFTYVPIANPTATWDPFNDAVLSNTVTVTQQDLTSAELEVTTSSDATPTNPPDSTSLSFGNILVGTSQDGTISASNSGDAGTTVSGTFPAPPGDFSAAGTPAAFGPLDPTDPAVDQTYTYTPSTTGADSEDIDVTSDAGDVTVTLSGKGVAPIQSIDDSSADAGNVRVGTSGTASFDVDNIGDGNTNTQALDGNLKGSVGSLSSEFSGAGGAIDLDDAASKNFSFTYTPTARGLDMENASVSFDNGSDDNTNSPQDVLVALSGTGVGPDFLSNFGTSGLIDFGKVKEGDMSTQDVDIENVSTDGDLDTLTDLTIHSFTITGADASAFDLGGSGQSGALGDVLAANGTGGLNGFDLLSQLLKFTATGPLGDKNAVLTFFTDQGAAFNGSGQQFSFDLHALVTPEPTSLAIWSLLGLGGAGYGWRKRKQKTGGRGQKRGILLP